VRELEDTKLDSLAKSVGLDQEDITRINCLLSLIVFFPFRLEFQ